MNPPFDFREYSEVLSGEILCYAILFLYKHVKSSPGFRKKPPFTNLFTEDEFKLRTTAFIIDSADNIELYKKALTARKKLEEWTKNGSC
jgi:hypothetical protein